MYMNTENYWRNDKKLPLTVKLALGGGGVGSPCFKLHVYVLVFQPEKNIRDTGNSGQ